MKLHVVIGGGMRGCEGWFGTCGTKNSEMTGVQVCYIEMSGWKWNGKTTQTLLLLIHLMRFKRPTVRQASPSCALEALKLLISGQRMEPPLKLPVLSIISGKLNQPHETTM